MRNVKNLTALLAIVLLSGCATLNELAQMQKPGLDVANLRFTGASLQHLDLALDVEINNPNALAVTLAGLDYDLQINDNSFLQGNQVKQMRIEAGGKSMVEIPLRLDFRKLYQTFNSLKNSDSTGYAVAAGLSFDLPVLGATRIPISKAGMLPLFKLPDFNLNALRVKNLSLTSADLEVELGMKNPNSFNFLLQNLNYAFNVNGQSWAAGNLTDAVNFDSKGSNSVIIPISLNMLEMGRTAFNLLRGDSKLDYSLSGDVNLKSSLDFLQDANLPIDLSGLVNLTR